MRNSPITLATAVPAFGFVVSAFFLLASFGLSGCGDTTYKTINYFLDNEEEADLEDTGTDSDDEVEYVDSADSPDTETETGTDDTAETEDTEVEDTGAEEPACEYVTETWDGNIALQNNLIVSLNEDTPSGEISTGTSRVLILDFTATDPDCSDLLVTGFSIRTSWTDNAGTGWYPSWLGVYIGVDIITGVGNGGGIMGGTTSYIPVLKPFVVPAGETVTVIFAAEMLGASAIDDDAIVFGLYTGSLSVYDGENLVVLKNDMLDGRTLVF